ncbi:MAG: endopeptidase La [Ruminococcus sp.]|nr:endopeptidase La [Ruminococcus sp.]
MEDKRIKIIDGKPVYPCVPTRELVVFPNMVLQFDVGRQSSVRAMKNAMTTGELVFLVAQCDATVEHPEKKDVFEYGTLAKVKQIVKTPSGVYRCLVEGVRKAKLKKLYDKEPFYEAEVREVANYSQGQLNDTETEAVMRELKEIFTEYTQVIPRMPKELLVQVIAADTPIKLFEAIAFNIVLPFSDKQTLLEVPAASSKLVMLITLISHEIEILTLEAQIHEQVHESIDRSQREYYIREQIKALQNELGEGAPMGDMYDDIAEYREKINALNAGEDVKKKLNDELKHLQSLPLGSQDAALLRNYFETVFALPWDVRTTDTKSMAKAAKILEQDHYGMKKVKERIIENLSVLKLTGGSKGQIICLAGPPGVGKTSVAKSIARALGRKYVRVSLGGVTDESEIRGHRKTYIGAMPGRIMDGMRQAGSKNPVMLLDEIDKMGHDFRGDPSSAMLEVLDSEQNTNFRDHYLDVAFDLSEVLFITTANTLDTIPAPLLDRMELIELPSYTREEKFNIAKKHLIPKQLEKHGLRASQLRFGNDAIYAIIDGYTREAGVRTLERNIAAVCRKAARRVIEGEEKLISVRGQSITDFLGHRKYLDDDVSKKDEIGVVNGLAWTSVGGVIMPLEVLVLDGKGKIELTGSLGDVMKESARIAVSLCRSLAGRYGVSPDFYENKDLHIHAPEGAVPKDGPSAGVTMTTAIMSALSGLKVRGDVAMTGEITLRGKVLPIGGLREKTMAAYKAGMKTVIVPKQNEGDLDEIDDTVKLGLEFVFAETITDVFDTALIMPAARKNEQVPYELVKKPIRKTRKAQV